MKEGDELIAIVVASAKTTSASKEQATSS